MAWQHASAESTERWKSFRVDSPYVIGYIAPLKMDSMVDRTVIRMKNAAFYAYHGVGEGEQRLGGKFECDVEIHGDFAHAAETDALQKTVDYEQVYAFIQTVVMERRYYLLEALANRIAGGLLREFYNIEEVLVRVRKPHPPVRGVVDYVEVEVTQHR